MAISCGARCAKGVLITFNLVFWLSGCALLALGIFVLVEDDRATLFRLFRADESHALIQYLAYGCIGVGGLIFLVGFLGCCGAIQESRCMLIAYFVFLFLILAAELAVGILAVIFQDKMITHVQTDLTKALKEKFGPDPTFTKAIDLTQSKFECCGIGGADDYMGSTWKQEYNKGNDEVPKTCCVLVNKSLYMEPKPVNNTQCQKSSTYQNAQHRHQSNCLNKLEQFIKGESLLLIALGCGLAALEIFGMIFAICLCKEI